jgi:hypothetical protein
MSGYRPGQIFINIPYPKSRGWIGCDLDGTFAHYEPGDIQKYGETYIGPPIPKMLERIKRHLARGDEVKIVTARVADGSLHVIKAIQAYTELHLGRKLEVTATKDYNMIALYDDRAIQIITNTGERADGKD